MWDLHVKSSVPGQQEGAERSKVEGSLRRALPGAPEEALGRRLDGRQRPRVQITAAQQPQHLDKHVDGFPNNVEITAA